MTFPHAIQNDRGEPSKVRIGQVTGGAIVLQGTVLSDVGILGSYIPVEGDSVALLGQSAVGTSGSSWLALGRAVTYPNPGFRSARLIAETQLIANASMVTISWSSTSYDTDEFWNDPFVTPTLVTIPFTGVFAFTLYVQFAVAAGGFRYAQIARNSTVMSAQRLAAAPGADFGNVSLSAEFEATAGDVIEFQVFQTSGAPLNIDEAAATVRLVGQL